MKKYTLEQTNEELNRKNEDINIGTSYEHKRRKKEKQASRQRRNAQRK